MVVSRKITDIFQSTLPVRGATERLLCGCRRLSKISIHAPRAGSDYVFSVPTLGIYYFNPRSPCGERHYYYILYMLYKRISIHAPRAGSDQIRINFIAILSRFQSTLPVRGATRRASCPSQEVRYFNPRSPCGERRGLSCGFFDTVKISIHAPRAGSDAYIADINKHPYHFNPRSPCGERPMPLNHVIKEAMISIHAPRAGSDARFLRKSWLRCQFQSTLPVRGATIGRKVYYLNDVISIHAPRAGSDCADCSTIS